MSVSNPLLLAVATAVLGSSVCAQNPPLTFTLPSTVPIPRIDNRPFAAQRMRYQQWHAAFEVFGAVGGPCRIVAVEFKAGSPGGQQGRTIDVEITMANAPANFSSGSFDNNMVSGRVVVFPRGSLTLGTAIAGTYPLTVNFTQDFVWDGQSGVVIDVKLFDNGNNNTGYPYDFELSIANNGRVDRMWASNDPYATFATVHRAGEGVSVKFHYQQAVTVPFGDGCPGDGNVVPTASTSGGLPVSGNSGWTQELSNAPSQRTALWLLGGNRSTWGTVSLPHELLEIGAAGCFLLTPPMIAATATTIGGGAGAGQASLNTPLPPVTIFVGASFFSQWLIVDPRAPNGVLAATGGLWHVVGP